MNHRKKRIGYGAILAIVLSLSFVAAVVFYFVDSFISTEMEGTVYSTLEEPTLPVVYAVLDGRKINPMKGYYQDMGNEAADTVSPLPEDRKLEICIRRYRNSVTGLSYEIRNLSMDHFIEKTEVTDLVTNGDEITAYLPIQNLIEKDTQYMLCITLDKGETKVHYYTKILWTDNDYASQMMQMAEDFTRKTFDYEAAKELTPYMETDPKVDNSNLGLVTIGSSFAQLTWASTGMRLSSEPLVSIRECSGIMGAVKVEYRTKMTVPAGEEEYNNVDEFTMRIGTERIYLMNYHRNTYEIFSGSKHRFAGKKIMLGITGEDALSTAQSENGRFIVFKSDMELWCYDQEAQEAINVFSFRSRTDDGIRSGWRDHDIKILGVTDDGTIDFAVYGYMNRGRHEGYSGLVYYKYSMSTGTTAEGFFAPFNKGTEKIGLELKELCTNGSGDMFYFKQNGTVIAVDMKSLEMMEVVSGLTDGTCLSDAGQTRFAWVENGRYGSSEVKVMNIATGAAQTIETGSSDLYRLLCFSGSDLVLGKAHPGEIWMIGKRIRSMPFYKLEIYDEDLKRVMEYEKSGQYVDDFSKDANRFIFNLYSRSGEGGYVMSGADTIVCAGAGEYNDKQFIGTTTSGEKQTVYYVAIEKEIKNTKNLKLSAPDSVSYENSGNIEIRAEADDSEVSFFAYANGKLRGKTAEFGRALDLCYGDMGWITDRNGTVVYNRTDRGTYHTVQEPFRLAQPLINSLDYFTGSKVTDEGYLLIDAYGIDMERLLYFVNKNCPVAILWKEGGYALIYGYDSHNIKLYHPAEGDGASRNETMSREAAAELFAQSGNDFLCYVKSRR